MSLILFYPITLPLTNPTTIIVLNQSLLIPLIIIHSLKDQIYNKLFLGVFNHSKYINHIHQKPIGPNIRHDIHDYTTQKICDTPSQL